MTSPPRDYEQLLDRVTAAVRDDTLDVARRHVMRAGARAGTGQQLRGAVAALELVCDIAGANQRANQRADERADELLLDLQKRTAAEPASFANAVGCTLSDAGDRLDDELLLELAARWLGRVAASAPSAIAFANHGIVLERLERWDDAITALARAVELDPAFHGAQLRLARAAVNAGNPTLGIAAYRAYLEARPDDAHEWISLAITLCDAGRVDEAEQAYWRAAGIEPANVSLHFNWLLSALRNSDLERARDAAKKLRSVAAADWRTQLADVFVVEASGDALTAFQRGRELFLDVIAEHGADSTTERAAIEYVASAVAGIAVERRDRLEREAAAFVADVFDTEVFTAKTLELARILEGRLAAGLAMYSVQVEALYRDGAEPFACFVNYRVLARDPDEATRAAREFEERCGASEVRVAKDELEELERVEGGAYPGVTWRSGRMLFPADEFGVDG